MESPKVVGRILLLSLATVTLTTLAVVGVGICCRDYSLLGFGLACLGMTAIFLGIAGVVNVIVFTPVFWLLGWLTTRRVSKPDTGQPQSPPAAADQPPVDG